MMIALAVALACGGCDSGEEGGADAASDTDAASTVTAYRQLGEEAGIAAFVDGLLLEELKDPDIAAYFVGLGQPGSPTQEQLAECLTMQLSRATGGRQIYGAVPVTGGYTCRPMLAAHQGLGITGADFDKFVTIAAGYAAEQGVPADVIEVLAGFLDSVEDEIVEAP